MHRLPRRDMTRKQAPHGKNSDWEMRWRSMWGKQVVRDKGLSGMAALNEMFKAIYREDMPPGSPPTKPRFSGLFPGIG